MPKPNNNTSHNRQSNKGPSPCAGQFAQADSHALTTMRVGCLPILNRILERMKLEEFLQKHLKRDGSRTRIPTPRALLVLVRNLLISREPIYGIGEWAADYAPDLLGLSPGDLFGFNDDRVGRASDKLFVTNEAELVMDVVRHSVREFGLSLNELHNDGTSVSVFGA